MSVVSDVREHLKDLMEGAVSGVPRAIPSGRFIHDESDDEGAAPGTESAPYPFGIYDGGAFEPFNVRSTLSGSHAYRGKRLIVRVGYSPDIAAREERSKTISTDEAAILKCLRHQRSWDAVSVDNGGEGVTDASVESSSFDLVEVETPDASQPPQRLVVLDVVLALTIREDHTS